MKDDSDLPPPVTRNSSKRELWEELECARQEIDVQQHQVNSAREQASHRERELVLLRYQLQTMRAVLSMQVNP